MIHLTRLNGQGFVLNPDLILKAEATPDTVVTLVDGTKFVVSEPLAELSRLVLRYRAQVVATARELPGTDESPGADADADRPSGTSGPTLVALETPADDDDPAATHGRRAAESLPVLAEPVPLRRRRRI